MVFSLPHRSCSLFYFANSSCIMVQHNQILDGVFSEAKLLIYLFIYNQIPPQSEENNILHKRTEIKY